MAQAENIDSRLMNNTLEPDQENDAAKKLKEERMAAKGYNFNNFKELPKWDDKGGGNNIGNDEKWLGRLGEAEKRNKAQSNLEKNFIGKQIAKKAANKVAEGSTKIFKVLLIIALMVDLLEYLDLGIFSALVNVGIYAIVVTAGFFTWFLKNNNNKYNIFNLLKGQMWKYLIMPLFEMVPLVNLLPFWTGTVVMMWIKVSYERKKLSVINTKDKKDQVKLAKAIQRMENMRLEQL